MEGIKLENTVNICHGCLSKDRRLSDLADEYSATYEDIIANRKNLDINDEIRMCWECKAMLKKFKLFQQQLHLAQDILIQMFYQVAYHPVTLSKLGIFNKHNYDREFKFGPIITDKNKDDLAIQSSKPMVWDIKKESILKEEPEEPYADYVPDSDDEMHFSEHEITSVELPVESNKKPPRAKRRRQIDTSYRSNYYKQFATLIKGEKRDWGVVSNYYTTTMFGEAEMEEHILGKERRLSEYTRFKFKCDLCQRGYKKDDDLKRHNDLNHRDPNQPIKCSLCDQPQSSPTALELHWRTHSVVAKCKMCNDFRRPRGMKLHLEHTHTHSYACRFCDLTFGNIVDFGIHYEKMHQYCICDFCNLKCTSKRILERHIGIHHIITKCIKCDRVFPNRKTHNEHCFHAHPKDTPKEMRYCVECDRQFDTLKQYTNHLKWTHTKIESVHKCPYPNCDKMFKLKASMKHHYDYTHMKKTNYYCEPCDKYFHNPTGLRCHIARIHKKLPPVKNKVCDICNRAFSNNRILTDHRNTHTGERPYQCPHCPATFRQKAAMMTHCKALHKDVK